jgi:hypothetical protein
LTLTAEELFAGDGLICEVLDFDKFGQSDKLGFFTVPPKVLYDGTGERLEFQLVPSKGQSQTSVGSYVCLRQTSNLGLTPLLFHAYRELSPSAVGVPRIMTRTS